MNHLWLLQAFVFCDKFWFMLPVFSNS